MDTRTGSSTQCEASASSCATKSRMKLSIRTRLSLWFSGVVALIIVLLGAGIFYGASWGLQRAADLELRTGLDGVSVFLFRKFARHEMNNLTDELQEHSSLLPRGKMLRVRYVEGNHEGALVYQADSMRTLTFTLPRAGQVLLQNIQSQGKFYRSISRTITLGQDDFLIELAVDQSEYVHLKEHLVWLLILALPVGLVLAGLAGYWTSNRILIPLALITEMASSIDARNLGSSLPLSGTNDELDRLSQTLNGMLQRIYASYERIAQFTADASHELRTPVTHIRSDTELLLMKAPPGSGMAFGLSEILAECDYMAKLISDLLTLARADASNNPLTAEIFELTESADAILPRVRALAATRNISFRYRPHHRVAPVLGDRNAVQRIMMILLDNAVRYTPNEGVISLEIWTNEMECGFAVTDTGIGLAPEHHQRIFERFYRVDTARTPQDGGSGLGLAIVVGLLRPHRGKITVKSELGQGACFRIAFPRADLVSVSDSQLVGA